MGKDIKHVSEREAYCAVGRKSCDAPVSSSVRGVVYRMMRSLLEERVGVWCCRVGARGARYGCSFEPHHSVWASASLVHGPDLTVHEFVSMPLHELRSRPHMVIIRQVNALKVIYEEVLELFRHSVVCNEQAVIISQADEVTIEQPMARG